MSVLNETIRQIGPVDAETRRRAHARLEKLTMPFWALGRLMDLAEELAAMTGAFPPRTERKVIVTMAADHGVTEEGVSLYPSEVTAQMVRNFVLGRAGVNALARVAGCRVVVVDMGVKTAFPDLHQNGLFKDRRIGAGTGNIAREPAMTREEARAAVQAGIEIARELGPATDVFGTGDMGIGNTTASAAIGAAVTGRPVEEIAGNGTGLNAEKRNHKVAVIKRALTLHKPDPSDGLDLLSKVGGFEIGGIAGLILGAAALRKPVVIDGFISTAGALVARALCPQSADYLIAAHRSAEKGHALLLEALGKKSLLDLGMRLGEGTGAALAMPLVNAAARLLSDVATFDEAGVSKAGS